MPPFEFHPELFALRDEARGVLQSVELEWLSDYTAIDVVHDLYGLEVCGIRDEADVPRARRALMKHLQWPFSHAYLKDYGRDPGWKLVVHRNPRRKTGDEWQTAD